MDDRQTMEGTEQFLDRLISAALAQERLQGISSILEMIARRFEASGCALWELGDPIDNPPKDTLFILAEWFEDGGFMGIDSLKVATSVSGKALRSGEAQYVESLDDSRVDDRKDSLQLLGIRELAAIPVRFSGDHSGVLTVYRRQSIEWVPEIKKQLERIAPLVSGLYEAIHNRVRTNVVQEANSLLQRHSISTAKRLLTRQQVTRTVSALAKLIADSFQCLEVSVFLRDPGLDGSTARLIATTWNRSDQDEELTFDAKSRGTAAWVLRKGAPVMIFDLQRVELNKRSLQKRYPGLAFAKLDSIIRQVRASSRMADHSRLPPLSLMAVPIRRGGARLGALRCFVPTENPYFFSDRERAMLEVLGALLADFWASWLARRGIDEENAAWRNLIDGIKGLNAVTQDLLAFQSPLEKSQMELMRSGLEILERTIPAAPTLDIRLLDKEGYLYFADVLGDAWNEGTKEEVEERLGRRFETRTREPESVGAWVVKNNLPYEVENHKRERFYSPTFPGTMLYCAPISDGKEVLGVLDLRSPGQTGIPKNASQVATLLGQQLGLCVAVVRKADQLRKTAEEQRRQKKDQRQIYEDLSHQLKTPVIHGYERIRAVVDGEVQADKIQWNLHAIRGQSRRAVRVVTSLGIFAELAEGRPIHIDPKPLVRSYLVKMLIESATDTQFLIKPSRHIRFDVNRESFGGLNLARFHVDRALLEQAVGNIFDNARKYSYPRTNVSISGGLTKNSKLTISTTSTGHRVQRNEIQKMKRRLWRSDEAKMVTGEGTGIGLWIVDNIMRAHGGELEINLLPASATEVKLIFPSS